MSKELDIARAYGFEGTEEELRAAASIVVASSPPRTPTLGDIWIDPETGALGIAARTQSEDLEEAEPAMWRVPDDTSGKTFETRDAALARAWELTPAGGVRPEPVKVTSQAEAIFDAKMWSTDWITPDTLRWVGFGAHADIEMLKRTAVTEMSVRAASMDLVLDGDTLQSFTKYDSNTDRYRVEITAKAV
jgi:hypothetical protein